MRVSRPTRGAPDDLAHVVRIGAFDACHRPALDGDALHVAALWEVVVDCVMLGRAVVPHDQRVRRPVMTELIFGYLRLLEQNIEQGLALAFVHVLDRDRELWIDEQDLAASYRVHAYDRMNRRRVQLLPAHHVLSIVLGIVEQFAERLEVVYRFETRDELLHAVAKAVEGRRHTRSAFSWFESYQAASASL